MSLQKIVERIRRGVEGSFEPHTNSLRVHPLNNSQFGEQLTVQRTPIIELNSSYGRTEFRNIEDPQGSGSISEASTGEFLIETGTTAGSSFALYSAEIARYIPGYSAQLGNGMRFDGAPTGDAYAEFGGESVSGNDGLYFGYDSGGIYVARRNGGVEVDKFYQASWNIDKLNGEGLSGVNLNMSVGTIFQIEYTWYGYGQCLFGVIKSINGHQQFIPCHEIIAFDEGTSVQDPNFKLFQRINNGTTTTNFQAYIGGRQYSIVGDYVPKYRLVGDLREDTVAIDTTPVPLISMRRVSGSENISVRMDSFSAINTGNQLGIVEVRFGSTLSGDVDWSTPRNHKASECTVEVNFDATGISGGNIVHPPIYIEGGAGSKTSLTDRNLDFDIPNSDIVSVVGYTFTSSTNMYGALRLKEEW